MHAPQPSSRRHLIGADPSPASAPFSPAVVVGDLVWTSGALPIDADGNTPSAFTEQVRLALGNLDRALRAAGADWSTVVKINGYVADIERLPELNAVYREIVAVHGAPARTTVEVPKFRGSVLVEFDAVAVRARQS